VILLQRRRKMKRETAGFMGKGGKGILILAVISLIVFGVTFGYAAEPAKGIFPKMDIKLGHSEIGRASCRERV
jgi:hypothetical protein